MIHYGVKEGIGYGSPGNCEAANPMVSIAMTTYNHVHYIAQAIEGVLSQKTSFPFELIIGEDCSTDGTKDIVCGYEHKHAKIIRVIKSDQNVGLLANFRRVIDACKGKYIAVCGGDDYWTDPYKLQKQVDFLEANPDYGMVHTNCNILHDSSGIIKKSSHSRRRIPQGDVYEELLYASDVINPLTVMTRRKALIDAWNEIDIVNKSWLMEDYPTWLEISRHHKVGYINDVTATYRVLARSASHSCDPVQRFLFAKSMHDVTLYFIDKYGGLSEEAKRDMDVGYNLHLLRSGFLNGDYQMAMAGRQFLTETRATLPRKERCLIPLCTNRYLFLIGQMICVTYQFLKGKYSEVMGPPEFKKDT